MSLNWGNYPKVSHQAIMPVYWREDNPFLPLSTTKVLPHGNGRSYGDSGLNAQGVLLNMCHLNHFMAFDAVTGLLRCEGGVLLSDILSLIVPKGWFLPVLPGTQFVSVGGAIANDVHGKNHHRMGCFGHHVIKLELLRSNGERLICSDEENVSLFHATLGGLGLTGLILWAEIQLQPLASPFLTVNTVAFGGIKEFLQLSRSMEASSAYTVAWLDCQAQGNKFARGLFISANFKESHHEIPRYSQKKGVRVPFYFPSGVLNRWSISAFNELYYHAGKSKGLTTQHYEHYFFPLDRLFSWNKIYGKKGFLQYQFVLPFEAQSALETILKKIADSGLGSFLSVLKTFGERISPGLMSFPMPGITLALDFPNRQSVFDLLQGLDEIVMAEGGRVYIAKDARMSAHAFKCYYPQFKTFANFIDPHFSSSFWRRVTETNG